MMKPLPRASVIALALLASGVCTAQQPEMLNKDPIVLPEVKVREKIPPRKVYELKVEKLWDGLGKKPTIRYLDVLSVAYDTAKFDLVQVLVMKKEYRAKLKSDYVFLCNYGAVATDVPIKWQIADFKQRTRGMGGPAANKRAVGFDYKTGQITLLDSAPLPALLQASGAALSGSMSKKSADHLKAMDAKSRAVYMQRQIEFELQLQDLNRFHAAFQDGPIMGPLDSIRALAMLGFRMEPERLVQILAEEGAEFRLDAVKAAINEGVVKRQYATVLFDHAFRLVKGMRQQPGEDIVTEDLVTFQISDGDGDGLDQMSGVAKSAQLKKIIFEAPGHI